MNAPPFPLNPSIGQWFGNWAWNGAQWVASPTTGIRQNVVTFTESGPYMPSPGLVSLTVECIGGGGCSGAAGPVQSNTWVLSAGGGGSGGYSRKTLPAALVRGGVLVTVGPGGVAAQTGAEQSGGATSFGALCMANGGGYGLNNNGTDSWGGGGSGASPGIGDVTFAGAAGGSGTLFTGVSEIGIAGGLGGVIYGGNGTQMCGPGQAIGGIAGLDSTGAGATGAVANQVDPGVTPMFAGGDGGSGICIVTETLWGDRDQAMPEWRPPLDVNVSFPKPPWPGGGPWPPGAWWPPGGWWGPGPWGPGPGGPRPREAIEGREFEAGQPYDQSINPQTGLPWEDEP